VNGSVVTANHELQFTSNTSNITSNALHTSASRVFNVVAATNSTGGGTASLSSNVSFSAANGVTFYTSAGNAIVGSVRTDWLSTQSGQGFSAGGVASAFQTLEFQDSNGVSFSNNAGSLRVTHDLQYTSATSAITSNALHSSASRVFNIVAATNNTGGGTASLSSNVSFSAANGITFYTSAGGAVVASHNALTSQSIQSFSAGGVASAFQTLEFQDSNGVSFSNNAGSLRVTHALQFTSATSAITSNALHSSAPAWTVSATNDSGVVRRVHFGTGNGISFGLSTSNNSQHTITASHNAITSQTNQTLGFYATSNTTGESNSSTFDARSLTFHGAGIASVGYSGGSVVISVPAGGGAGDGFNRIAVDGSTATSLGTVLFANANGISFSMDAANGSRISASISQAQLSNSNNVSFGMAGSTITATATFPSLAYSYSANTTGTTQSLSSGTIILAGGSGITLQGATAAGVQSLTIHGEPELSRFWNGPVIQPAGALQGNSLVSILPVLIPHRLVCSNLKVGASVNVATAANTSSAYIDVTISAVLYSRNVSSLSSILSGSSAYTQFFQSNSTGSATGIQQLVLTHAATTLNPGDYWWAIHVSTTNSATGGANTTALANSFSMMVLQSTQTAAHAMRAWGANTNSSQAAILGQGVISTGATRASIAFSDYTVTGTRGMNAGLFLEMRNATVY
jgi:hypothetical protein